MTVQVRAAVPEDFGAIFALQRAAFVDEARLYETPFVPSLDETLAELTDRLNHSTSWVAIEDGRIVGAVSLRTYRNDLPDVERLMVAPDMRGRGISSALLTTAEEHARATGCDSMQLIVGDLATANRAIYAHLGWVEQYSERLAGYEHVVLHTMTKTLSG